ncbi:MAG: hypothetical protein RLZZ453_931 [Chlamydiota bacterium]|jgi:hypothetical protein
MNLVSALNNAYQGFVDENPHHPNPRLGAALDVLLNCIERVEKSLSGWQQRVQSEPSLYAKQLQWGIWAGSGLMSGLKISVAFLGVSAEMANTTTKRVIALGALFFVSNVISNTIRNLTYTECLTGGVVSVIGAGMLYRVCHSTETEYMHS